MAVRLLGIELKQFKGSELKMSLWFINKKDSEGNKFQIRIRFDDRENKLRIDDVGFTPKGKRKVTFIGSSLTSDYSWRALNTEDRNKAQKQEILKYISEDLLMEALNEAWEQSRPTELNF